VIDSPKHLKCFEASLHLQTTYSAEHLKLPSVSLVVYLQATYTAVHDSD